MKIKKSLFLVAACLLMQPLSSFADGCFGDNCYDATPKKVAAVAAEPAEMMMEPGYYGTIGAGWRFMEKDEEILGHVITEVKAGAYRFTPDFSAEVGFGYAPDVRNREFPSGEFRLDSDTSYVRLTADLLYHPFEESKFESFDPYLAIGGGVNFYEDDLASGSNDLFYGGGFGAFVDLDEQFFVKPDYRVHNIDGDLSQDATLALGVRFCL